ncbi:MAG: tryptophanase [Planctomycetes bacterium]|nr:tryptophanase [Planctomycetota bacterium]
MNTSSPIHEPHKIKTVRPVAFPSLDERKRLLMDAHFNLFNLTPSQVVFDMASLGTSAYSQEQLSGELVGDEAYAGARTFETLVKSVQRVLGHTYVCPTHNVLGSVKLLAATLSTRGSVLASNARGRIDVLSPRGIEVRDVRDAREPLFTGNTDLTVLERELESEHVSAISIHLFADGRHPVSLANLTAVRAAAEKRGVRLVLDASRIIENAWFIQRHEPGQDSRPIAEIVRQLVKTSHVMQLDGAQDPKCNTGGLLTTDNPADHERFMNEVVVYEGLHTYGGMSGRTMEVLARGLDEMCDESEVQWVMHQTQLFNERLRKAGVPFEAGCDGAYLVASAFLPHVKEHAQHALAAALYQMSGVRALVTGLVGRDDLVPVQIPRLAMTNWQLAQVADAIVKLYSQRARVAPVELQHGSRWHDALRFRSVFGDLENYEFDCFPFTIHTIERIAESTRDQREKLVRDAGYNTFLLPSSQVAIDLLTDSGTSAMSTEQWAAYSAARSTPGTSEAYHDFVAALRDVYGYQYILPTHQGRAAEHILSQTMIKPGQLVPGNMYFTTTKLHQELAGGVFVDIIVDEAHDPASNHPWKGDIDLAKLERCVAEHGPEKIAYISFEHTVNMAGGQPVSMQNMKDVYAYCSARKIPVFFDATRAAENAYMIQKRDPRYAKTKVKDILREMMLYGDGATVSGKKDFLINIGGVLAFKDNADWAQRCEDLLRIYEGGVHDGGMPAADLAAMAKGVHEMLDDRYIRTRVEQAAHLAQRLMDAGVPIVMPPGSHAIFIDVKRFLPHVDQDEYPAQMLAAQIYVETGVRAMERGNVSKGRDAKTGQNYRPALELVRLTIPRRVYTNDHMRAVADGVIRLYERRHTIHGLRFVYEPPMLRFFQGRFAPIEPTAKPPEPEARAAQRPALSSAGR